MARILVVEDNQSCMFLIKAVITTSFPHTIICAETVDEALPHIDHVDLVITDFDYPGGGFLALLPNLQKASRSYILQSADPDNLKVYDPILQLGTIAKGATFVSDINALIRSLKIQ